MAYDDLPRLVTAKAKDWLLRYLYAGMPVLHRKVVNTLQFYKILQKLRSECDVRDCACANRCPVCLSVELELRKVKSYIANALGSSTCQYVQRDCLCLGIQEGKCRCALYRRVQTFCSLYVPWQWESGFARLIVQLLPSILAITTHHTVYTHNI